MSDLDTWTERANQFEKLLRLRTFPLGLKLYEDESALNNINKLKTPKRRTLICQLVTLSRTVGWTIGVTLEQLLSGSPCAAMIGLDERKEVVTDGTYRSSIWFESKTEGRKCEESFPHLPAGKYRAMAVGPIESGNFDPDIVIIYGTPAQMILIVNAIQWRDYERLNFFCIGESSCSDYIAECYLSQKPSLTLPCFGERFYGHAQEEELVISIPSNQVDKVLDGLKNLAKRGIRYPIPYSGNQMDVISKLTPFYRDVYGIDTDPLFRNWEDR